MGYVFPASPLIGDSANGYTWNGQGWAGGQNVSISQVEQFFDLAGLASKDITVPTWARGVQITGAIYGTTGPGLRISLDGTTFLAGASDYYNQGPGHQALAGTPYTTTAPVAGSTMYLSAGGDEVRIPHQFEAFMNLTRPASTDFLGHLEIYTKSAMVSGSAGPRTWWGQSYAALGATGSSLAIKALRFLPGSGNFGAGSYARVSWVGDTSSVVTGSGGGENLANNSCAITCNANQSINSAAFAQVTTALNSVVHDPASMWDATNKRIIPKKAGLFLFSGLVSIETVPDAIRMVTAVYKNGAIASLLGRGSTGASAIAGFGGSVLLKANGTTDYFELWVYHNSGSAQNVVGVIGSGYGGYTHFGATYVGSA